MSMTFRHLILYWLPCNPAPLTFLAWPSLQVGMGAMECYERDFEEFMLNDTAEYYRRKAAVWIQVRRGGLGRLNRVLQGATAAQQQTDVLGGSNRQHSIFRDEQPSLHTPSDLLPFVPAFFSCFPPAFFCRRTAPPTTSSRRRSA